MVAPEKALGNSKHSCAPPPWRTTQSSSPTSPRDVLDQLESFYQRYGCELVQRCDGYFYLRPSGERLGRRQLSADEMLVGQTLALL